MIRLADMNEDELEQFERRIKKGFYKRGVVIEYHVGAFGDEVNHTKLGSMMWKLHELGVVDLVQKKLGFERFGYWAVVK